MNIDNHLINMEVLIKDAQAAKSLVLTRLLKDNVITDEQAKYYYEGWQIIIIKKSWWKNWKNIFTEKESGGYTYRLVKID
jgi:hypothetical protein